MSGAIIPDPFAKPAMVTGTPSMVQVALAPLGKVSVVRIACEALAHPSLFRLV
jgi:hypothetical protein